jgi:imidazolonepropionase-like amidohydrolase
MDLVIRNVRLIEGTGAGPVPRVSVEVANGVISWIGEESARPRRRTHREDINGEGLTLVPGLIDCHEHFAGDGGPGNMERNRSDTPESYTLMAASNARRALMSGVTSARDVGSPYGVTIRVAQDTASGAVLGPRIVASGEWLSFPGTTWPTGVGTRLSRRVETMEDLILAIQEQIGMGAGLIKVGANGRNPNGDYYGSLGPEVLDAAVRAAHGSGLKIAAHCIGFEASRQATEAGVDSIEHGTHLEEDTVRRMAERGTYLVPTLSTWDIRERLDRQNGSPSDQVAENLDRKEVSLASFRLAMQAGVRIATGTDAGGSPVRHGFVAREIELMVQAGMTPQAALESSTREAADLLGVLDEVGTIEVGKRADMLLVDGDPHSDPAALRNVWAVFLSGRRVL